MSLTEFHHSFEILGDQTFFTPHLQVAHPEIGKTLVHISITAEQEASPPEFTIRWMHPIHDIQGFWFPTIDRGKGFRVDWEAPLKSRAAVGAPVASLYSMNGRNRLTFAFSDAVNPIGIKAGVHEETSEFLCEVNLFAEPTGALKCYEAELLLDTRDVPYYDSLNDVQLWWASKPSLKPSEVPEVARQPMYSTWYSLHQQFTADEVEIQCREAKALGCEAVILDDGWQTLDNSRGYAYCGDWQLCTEKIPDMKKHVDRVHQLGMKYLLWYSVPFVGKMSNAWPIFADKLLYINDNLNAGVVDPRFAEVREYLIRTYEKAVEEWNLDGFKLDFMDSFILTEEGKNDLGRGRDYVSVPDAVDRLLSDILTRLRALKPDILIEFRQSYVGPLMRKYGNMFRASDCPNDALQNRLRTLDVRLLCGNTAVHADPLMWNAGEAVEVAALQLINVLFSVPQVSVAFDKLPEAHRQMVKFWISFWSENRDVLLDGYLEPMNPELNYPLVKSSTSAKRLIAVYYDIVIRPGEDVPNQLIIVNGSHTSRLVMELAEDLLGYKLEVLDCTGNVEKYELKDLRAGLHNLDIPQAGIASWSKIMK